MVSSLSQRDLRVIWHPYTSQKYAPDPIPVVKGEGVWLTDEAGNRYIDAVSSWWVTIHGHGHPYIAKSIYEQALLLEQVIFTGFTHRPAVELAERLLPKLPGNFAKIFYSDNGSTATEVAVKMAIQYWWNKGDQKRTKILALKNGYHGDTFGAMSVSARGVFTLPFRDRLFEVFFAEVPEEGQPIRVEGIAPEQVAGLLQQCACVIYEPLLQGAGGMVMYSPAALDYFIAACREQGVVCIADEVMTGFGRTGQLFASSSASSKPDIICLSKGLTGGTMALGVTACTAEIHAEFVADDRMKTFFHGHSFTANPIACAAALASLDLVEKQEFFQGIDRVVGMHQEFCKRLESEKTAKGIANVRQCGTIVAFEVNDVENGYTSSVKEMITAASMARGVYLRPLGNTVYIMPPYCIKKEELSKVYDSLLEALEERKAK